MDYALVQAANGLVLGIIFAVIAVGLTLVFAVLKIVNFAHGELYMMGGYFAYYAIELLGLSPFPALAAAIAASFLLAALLERTLLTPLYSETTERKAEYGILITFGLSVALRNLALIVFGPFPLRPPSFVAGVQQWGPLILTNDRLVAGGVGLLVLMAVVYIMSRTAAGHALDAVSQSRESAAIVGIDPRLAYTLGFGLGGALAGAAGALMGPIFSLSPSMGILPDTQAFVIVILGGMGSVPGSIVAGILIGLLESLFTAFFPDPTRALSYSNAFGVLILMVILILRPTGLLGRRHMQME
ncbi:MAG: branched-chain amino acid ABC transporter permease [Bacillati bacterium ANGP1]|uniref:Branched-chain amino acid ABC transporter permease n=1 Tax=Candidatus Segetimicrobium genomatis TaxID=2569760 RepID=A0A537LDA5_9BACT|nr:MAG: branched-chain amino acid ABC transporter permease [Terrabacteria group bacterium ANGP1]TMJ12712.1 MAG: branched-chain amino acid ABC transporter permease [Terrabacteria group bacterium ANGP1]